MSLLLVERTDEEALSAGFHRALQAALQLRKQVGGKLPVDCWLTGRKAQQAARILQQEQAEQGGRAFLRSLYVDPVSEKQDICEEALVMALHTQFTRKPSVLASAPLGTYQFVISSGTDFGRAFLPRLAARLCCPVISNLTAITPEGHFVRPAYSGQLYQQLESRGRPMCITVHPAAFQLESRADNKEEERSSDSCSFPAPEIVTVERQTESWQRSKWLPVPKSPPDGLNDFKKARIVVGGGRGIGSAEGFARLELFAKRIGAGRVAAFGAVEEGFVSRDCLVGQSRHSIAPAIYIALGLSGAAPHMAGIAPSALVIGVNTDASAPIMKIADFSLQMDWLQFVEDFERQVTSEGGVFRKILQLS